MKIIKKYELGDKIIYTTDEMKFESLPKKFKSYTVYTKDRQYQVELTKDNE